MKMIKFQFFQQIQQIFIECLMCIRTILGADTIGMKKINTCSNGKCVIVDACGHLINNTRPFFPNWLENTDRHRSWENWRLKCVLNYWQNCLKNIAQVGGNNGGSYHCTQSSAELPAQAQEIVERHRPPPQMLLIGNIEYTCSLR